MLRSLKSLIWWKRSTLALLLLAATGCGGSESQEPIANATSGAAEAEMKFAAGKPTDPAAAVAYDFLDAVKRGDTNAATAKLTPLALKLSSENEMFISLPGNPTANFQVGEVLKVDAEQALVAAIWSEVNADGERTSEKTALELRLIEGEWRVYGMIADNGPDQPRTEMNYEDPNQYGSGAAPAASESPTARQAQQPAKDPFKAGVSR